MRYTLIFCLLFFVSCFDTEEDEVYIPEDIKDIVGSWQLQATKISPGGPVSEWTTVNNGPIYTFKSDYTFTLDKALNCNDNTLVGTFELKAGKLFLETFCNGSAYTPVYFIEFDFGKAIMQYDGCIEECSYRYVYIGN